MSFPMRPWFRASGWSPNHFLLAGTVGSCSKDLGTLCWPLTSHSQKERLREEWEVNGGHRLGQLGAGGSQRWGAGVSLGSALSGLGQIPCPPLWHPSARVRF